MHLNLDTRVAPHADVVWRLVEGEVVLLNVTSGQYYSLDDVGSRVWSLMPQTGITVRDLRVALLQEYDAPADEIDRDLLTLFERLRETELVAAT